MISEEAVEAAREAIERVTNFELVGAAADELARTALEAATTQLLTGAFPVKPILKAARAQAWEEGFERALDWGAYDGAPDNMKPDFTNPYRSGT